MENSALKKKIVLILDLINKDNAVELISQLRNLPLKQRLLILNFIASNYPLLVYKMKAAKDYVDRIERERKELEKKTLDLQERIQNIKIPEVINGYTPKKGEDYLTETELEEIKESVKPKKGVDYDDGIDGKSIELEEILTKIPKPKDGKEGKRGYTPVKDLDYFDGKDADPREVAEIVKAEIVFPETTGEEIVDKVNNLPLELDKMIDAKHIKHLPVYRKGSPTGTNPYYGFPSLETLSNGSYVTLPTRHLNFIGNGVTVTQDPNDAETAIVDITGGGGGDYTPEGVTTATVGGIAAGTDLGTSPVTIQSILDAMLYPYTAPNISLVSIPGGGLREFGNNLASVVLDATTIKTSNPITAVSFWRGASDIHDVASPNPNGGLETYTDTTPITTTTSYTSKVGDGTSTITSNTITFTFVYPYLTGQNPSGESFSNMYADFSHLIQVHGTKVVAYNLTVGNVPYFGYPASYADLTSIKDENGFETITSWTKRTGNIVGLDSTSQSYKVYEFNSPTGIAVTKTFTFV